MRILYATDHRCYLVDGVPYLTARIYPILKRYADAFGKVVLYARFIETSIEGLPKGCCTAEFVEDIVRNKGLSKTFIKNEELEKQIENSELVIVRVPAFTAYEAADCARRHSVPYLAEAMGCAWDSFWNHGIKGKLIAPYMYLKMKSIMRNANYALYVTEEFLQNRYPSKCESVSASNVSLRFTEESVLTARLERIAKMDCTSIKLMTTAAVNVRYKGHEYVIRALNMLKEQGINAVYYLAGAGDQSFLRGIAKKEDVENQVVFLGELKPEEVYEQLDQIDIYVQPSLQEGLPRAVIEAMSRGCPCIGARTAGIPELLEKEYVVERKSIQGIADKIMLFCKLSKEEKKDVAYRNYSEAQNYLEDTLNARRNAYFQKIQEEIG